jgi:hypothetical protein
MYQYFHNGEWCHFPLFVHTLTDAKNYLDDAYANSGTINIRKVKLVQEGKIIRYNTDY